MKSFRNTALAGLLALGMAVPIAYADDVQGRISAVDRATHSVVVNGQSYQVLPTTTLKKNNQSANFTDLAVGEYISADFNKSTAGKRQLVSADIGNKDAVGGTAGRSGSESGATFSGKVSKVDRTADTVTIGSQTYQIIASSRLMKDDKSINLADIKVGDKLTGQYKKSQEGKMEVLTAHVGAMGGTKDRSASQSGATFSGKISKVNAGNQTIVVDGKTYHLDSSTSIVSRDGSSGSMANLKANQHVTGTYKKDANGQMDVTSLHIGDKK